MSVLMHSLRLLTNKILLKFMNLVYQKLKYLIFSMN